MTADERALDVFEFVKLEYEKSFVFPKLREIGEHFGFNCTTASWYLGILIRKKKLRLVDPTAKVKQYRIVR